MSREVELKTAIAGAVALQAQAEAELATLEAKSATALEEARDNIVREAERLLELAADFSNQHQLDSFTVEPGGNYGDYYDGGGSIEWMAEATRNWNASTC